MNATQLATKMLEWETTQRAADMLRAEIEAEVLAVGKTQTVGNVRASYTKGRTTYDYQAAVQAVADLAAETDAALFRQIQAVKSVNSKTVYDWHAIATILALDVPIKSQSEPSVSLKLLA